MEWLDVKEVPFDTPIMVKTYDGAEFKARLVIGGAIDENLNPCCQWKAEEGEDYPDSWCDGCCWSSNSNEEASDPVVKWMPLPPQAQEE